MVVINRSRVGARIRKLVVVARWSRVKALESMEGRKGTGSIGRVWVTGGCSGLLARCRRRLERRRFVNRVVGGTFELAL